MNGQGFFGKLKFISCIFEKFKNKRVGIRNKSEFLMIWVEIKRLYFLLKCDENFF